MSEPEVVSENEQPEQETEPTVHYVEAHLVAIVG